MMHLKRSLLTMIAGAAVVLSCNKDEKIVAPTIANEALTTVQLQLTNTANTSDKPTAQWEQLLDNNGNPLPVDVSQANLTLKANSTYTAKLILIDKTQSPPFTVSDEIKDRGNYHLFFYQPLPTNQPLVIPNDYPANQDDIYPDPIPTPVPAGSPLNLTVTITDHDTNTQQYPIGLETKFVTGAASTGWLRIVLRHQPNTKDGTYTPGSTDLDVGFNVTIQ
jgi:hypothetical protein